MHGWISFCMMSHQAMARAATAHTQADLPVLIHKNLPSRCPTTQTTLNAFAAAAAARWQRYAAGCWAALLAASASLWSRLLAEGLQAALRHLSGRPGSAPWWQL